MKYRNVVFAAEGMVISFMVIFSCAKQEDEIFTLPPTNNELELLASNLSPMEQLGKKIIFDNISYPNKQMCVQPVTVLLLDLPEIIPGPISTKVLTGELTLTPGDFVNLHQQPMPLSVRYFTMLLSGVNLSPVITGMAVPQDCLLVLRLQIRLISFLKTLSDGYVLK
jgi:hypothetical protein